MSSKINSYLAFLIHKYPYQKGWIATLWLREYGLINAIMPRRTVQYNGEPFSLLQVYGYLHRSGGLSKFYTVEQIRMFYIPTARLYACLELNKIVYMRLKHDSTPALFDAYHEILAQSQNTKWDLCLYKFKMQILDTLGYGIQNDVDADNVPIVAHAYYRVIPFQPFKRDITGVTGATIRKMRCYEHLGIAEITILHTIVNTFLHYDNKAYLP